VSELVVFSHLRWTFVWQRPQHLISRLARGRRVWFVEEPMVADVDRPVLRTERHGAIERVWLDIPGSERHVDFGDDVASAYLSELLTLLPPRRDRAAWLYTPLALPLARALDPGVLVYDVMDDLASFKGAAQALQLAHRKALQEATVVFAGGRSLHAAVVGQRPDAHLFPSGVEAAHFAPAVEERAAAGRSRPVAGYVGVIDERLDLGLIGRLAELRPDWELRVVGPVAKIDPETLPRAENVAYPGAVTYARLPHALAGFDVALMPFALNEATKSISPTKTLEYLAAGLPVVSTPVPDVVAGYRDTVHLAEGGPSFAAACDLALSEDPLARRKRVEPLLRRHDWEGIARRMDALVTAARERPRDRSAEVSGSGTP
jgi:glycosyltransferase involved in cell wall biosynthesis